VKAKRVPVLASTTTAKAEDAGKIAMQLVERKLVATPIIGGSTSYLRWLEDSVQ